MGSKVKSKPLAPKKVKAYPFDATLDQGGIKKAVEVLFVGPRGLIAKLNKHFVQVGEHYQIQFVLPVIDQAMFTQVRVLKTYDKATSSKDRRVDRMAEFHFEKLTDDHKKYVFSFLAASRQSK